MVSSVTSPSNHYETLGVGPTADEHEIAKAFAAQLSLFKQRPEKTVARLAQLNLAFETLRDPIKRRAYDTSLRSKPKAVAAGPRGAAPFMATTPASRDSSPRLTPPEAEAQFETIPSSFLATWRREPMEQREPNNVSDPTHKRDPKNLSKASAEAHWAPVGESSVIDDHERPSEGNRATLAAGVLALGIVAFALSLPERKVDRVPRPGQRLERTLSIGSPPSTPVHDLVAPKGPASTAVNARGEQPALSGRGSVRLLSGEVAAMPPPQSQATMPGISRYTSLDPVSCRPLEGNVEGRDRRRRCAGFAGYALETSESQMKQDLAMVAPDGRSSELNLTSLVASGAFSRLGRTAEWRGLAGGQPRALIVRLNVVADYSDARGPDASNLLVVRLEPPTCIVAVVRRTPHQNEKARAVADGKMPPCLKRLTKNDQSSMGFREKDT